MAARSTKSKPRLPLKEIDDKNKKRIRELNGEFLNLYRVLGHHAKLLSAWIGARATWFENQVQSDDSMQRE